MGSLKKVFDWFCWRWGMWFSGNLILSHKRNHVSWNRIKFRSWFAMKERGNDRWLWLRFKRTNPLKLSWKDLKGNVWETVFFQKCVRDAIMKNLVLRSVKKLKLQNGWQWRGEFFKGKYYLMQGRLKWIFT